MEDEREAQHMRLQTGGGLLRSEARHSALCSFVNSGIWFEARRRLLLQPFKSESGDKLSPLSLVFARLCRLRCVHCSNIDPS